MGATPLRCTKRDNSISCCRRCRRSEFVNRMVSLVPLSSRNGGALNDVFVYSPPAVGLSAQDEIALTLFQSLLHQSLSGPSLITSIQTHAAAINIFRSILNMDAMDALEDLLSRCYGHSDEDVVRLLSSLETATSENTVARSSVFNAIRYTPLEYAVKFSPLASVQSLLAEGVDAAEEPSLAYAAMCGRVDLNKFLIDNHADVNMKDSQG
ncbi:hypothetical protein BC629DRAFT_960408 [Irpex lacteus]|nr:hypothetical protein BC629DRAFT_960408 [Irpex lacteus]